MQTRHILNSKNSNNLWGYKSEGDFYLVKMKIWILSNSPCQNCTAPPCLAPGQSLKDIRFWGLPFRSKLFHFQNFRGDGACKCTWHTIPPGPLRLRKCSRFFWLLFPCFLTEEEDLLWREDLLSSFERHNSGWQHESRVSWQPKMHHNDASLDKDAIIAVSSNLHCTFWILSI